jgi:hypothetical protein
VFLTNAFRAAGALAADNRVSEITQFEECPGRSTGRKLLLSVDYEKPAPNLFNRPFMKFSRDFDDAIRELSQAWWTWMSFCSMIRICLAARCSEPLYLIITIRRKLDGPSIVEIGRLDGH